MEVHGNSFTNGVMMIILQNGIGYLNMMDTGMNTIIITNIKHFIKPIKPNKTMKTTFFLLLGIFLMFPLLGQKPTMIEKKKMYNYKAYSWQQGDRYNPTVAGVFSFLIPGLGQITSGEAGRGLAFLVPSVVAEVVFFESERKFNEENVKLFPDISKQKEYASQVIISGIAVIGLSIWSAIDAVHVAKVNNMYFRDKSKNNVSLKIKPYTNILPDNNVGYGLSFAMSF